MVKSRDLILMLMFIILANINLLYLFLFIILIPHFAGFWKSMKGTNPSFDNWTPSCPRFLYPNLMEIIDSSQVSRKEDDWPQIHTLKDLKNMSRWYSESKFYHLHLYLSLGLLLLACLVLPLCLLHLNLHSRDKSDPFKKASQIMSLWLH